MVDPAVTVIVVSYNTKDKLRRCLSCIEPAFEIIVVDNASADGSPEMVAEEFPEVRLVRNEQNVGFGAANNQGSSLASAPLVLYLNSDAYAEPGAIARVAEAFADHDVVAAGGRLLNPDGTLQQSVASRLTLWMVFLEQSFLEILLRPYDLGYWRTPDGNAPTEVEQLMGACLMVRRGLETFDERYFLYCEDTDLCRRLSPHGRMVYVPEARFIHDLGSSSADRRWLGVARYNRGKELYFRIHYGALASAVCWGFDRAGALIRLLAWSAISVVKPAQRTQVQLFWKVLTARNP